MYILDVIANIHVFIRNDICLFEKNRTPNLRANLAGIEAAACRSGC